VQGLQTLKWDLSDERIDMKTNMNFVAVVCPTPDGRFGDLP
jgi:hypothetical protein